MNRLLSVLVAMVVVFAASAYSLRVGYGLGYRQKTTESAASKFFEFSMMAAFQDGINTCKQHQMDESTLNRPLIPNTESQNAPNN